MIYNKGVVVEYAGLKISGLASVLKEKHIDFKSGEKKERTEVIAFTIHDCLSDKIPTELEEKIIKAVIP